MAVVYHDLGLLVARQGHADHSAQFIAAERQAYLMDERERELIAAIVASHRATKTLNMSVPASWSRTAWAEKPCVRACLRRLFDLPMNSMRTTAGPIQRFASFSISLRSLGSFGTSTSTSLR